jgi:hypothetical protein
MAQDLPTVRVHLRAPKIAKRAGEILDEDWPTERVYQWIAAGKLRAFKIGPHFAIEDSVLIEDLTGGPKASAA